MVGALTVAAAVLVGGCGSAAAPGPDACADARTVMTHYTTDAPEYKAFTAAVEKQYSGTAQPGQYDKARAAYLAAYGTALRATANEARTPAVKTAITNAADAISNGTSSAGALEKLLTVCPGAS